MSAVDFRPMGRDEVGEDNIERRMVIADEDIAVIHRRRVHVRMVVDYGGQGRFDGLGGLRIAEAIRKDHAGAVAEDDEVALFVHVVGKGCSDAIKRLGKGWLPFGHQRGVGGCVADQRDGGYGQSACQELTFVHVLAPGEGIA